MQVAKRNSERGFNLLTPFEDDKAQTTVDEFVVEAEHNPYCAPYKAELEVMRYTIHWQITISIAEMLGIPKAASPLESTTSVLPKTENQQSTGSFPKLPIGPEGFGGCNALSFQASCDRRPAQPKRH